MTLAGPRDAFENLLEKLGIKDRDYLQDDKVIPLEAIRGRRRAAPKTTKEPLCTKVCALHRKSSKFCVDPSVFDIAVEALFSRDYMGQNRASIEESQRLYRVKHGKKYKPEHGEYMAALDFLCMHYKINFDND